MRAIYTKKKAVERTKCITKKYMGSYAQYTSYKNTYNIPSDLWRRAPFGNRPISDNNRGSTKDTSNEQYRAKEPRA